MFQFHSFAAAPRLLFASLESVDADPLSAIVSRGGVPSSLRALPVPDEFKPAPSTKNTTAAFSTSKLCALLRNIDPKREGADEYAGYSSSDEKEYEAQCNRE